MNSKQRFMAALRLEEVDRTPTMYQHLGAADHLQSVTGINIEEGFRDHRRFCELCLAALKEFVHDNVMVGWGDLLMDAHAFGVELSFPNPHEYPRGKEPDAAHVEGLVPVHPRDDPIWSILLDSATYLNDKVGKEVMVLGACSEPFLLATAIRGFENLLLDQMVDPPLVHRLVRVATDSLKLYATALREECGLEAVFLEDGIADPTQNDLESSLAFDIAYSAELVSFMRGQGLKVVLSNCTMEGYVREQMERASPDGIHFRYERKDRQSLLEAMAGSRCAVLGLDPLRLIGQGSPEQVRAAARQAMEVFGPHPGLILSAAGELPFDAPVQNIRALSEHYR
jgi:uroporphyrinogen-III decarboxylase